MLVDEQLHRNLDVLFVGQAVLHAVFSVIKDRTLRKQTQMNRHNVLIPLPELRAFM